MKYEYEEAVSITEIISKTLLFLIGFLSQLVSMENIEDY